MSKVWWVKKDQLDDSQLEVINDAGKGRGFILIGPPGAGKTNLLMLAAAAMKKRHYENTRVVVFTRTLKDFVGRGLMTYGLDNGTVDSLARIAYAIAREHGDVLDETSGFKEKQASWRQYFKKYLLPGNKIHRCYDALLLDESQDFNSSEIRLLFATSGYTVFSIDINQSIYERSDELHEVFKLQIEEELKEYKLECHYRTGRRICRFADLVMEGRDGYQNMEDNSIYKESERPSLVEYENFDSDQTQEFEKIIARTSEQINAYPGERIGILFPTNVQIEAFRQHCAINHPYFLSNESPPDDGLTAELFVDTMHAAKGLEFAVVHIAGQQKLSSFATQRTLLYTSVTRGRYACYITGSGKVPDYLTSAYRRLDGAAIFDTNSLFPRLI